jgi:hypothetical protein
VPRGCGEVFPINLDPRAGPAWRLYSDPRRGVSLYPSVWRESGCESHYVIWRNRIYLFGRYEDEFDSASTHELTKLVESVKDRLPRNRYMDESPTSRKAISLNVVRNIRKKVLARVGNAENLQFIVKVFAQSCHLHFDCGLPQYVLPEESFQEE